MGILYTEFNLAIKDGELHGIKMMINFWIFTEINLSLTDLQQCYGKF